MNSIAAAAITFKKATEPAFRSCAIQVLRNAKALAAALLGEGVTLVTGGTDNHMLVVDTVTSFGMDGKQAEEVLNRAGITTNKQVIPDDPRPPLRPSGIRLGTPACSTRGMAETEMERIAGWIVEVLRQREDAGRLARTSGEVKGLSAVFPTPGLN
jgi:glycine hydroxymethyltransferase